MKTNKALFDPEIIKTESDIDFYKRMLKRKDIGEQIRKNIIDKISEIERQSQLLTKNR